MEKAVTKNSSLCVFAAVLLAVLMGCSKTKLVDAPYPSSKVYMTQAAYVKQSGSAFYQVPANIYDQVVYFTVEGGKVNIPVGVSRSGVNISGDVVVNLTSTAAAASGSMEPLPASSFELPAAVTIKSGETNAKGILSIDQNFLLNSLKNNPAATFGLNVSITAPGNSQSEGISSALFVINPGKLLSPSADFFIYTYNDGSQMGYAVNKSVNAVSYAWDFGDGTPVVTEASPAPHKYAATGTYTITLKAKGVSDQTPVSVKTLTLTIL